MVHDFPDEPRRFDVERRACSSHMMFGVANRLVPFSVVPAAPTTRLDEFNPLLVVHTLGKPVGQLLVTLERFSVTTVPVGAEGLLLFQRIRHSRSCMLRRSSVPLRCSS